MSNTTITINDIHAITNTAYQQTVNALEDNPSDITAIDFSKFNSEGNTEDVKTWREKFTGELFIEISKTYYKKRFNADDLNDIYWEDADKFGAIVQILDVDTPDAIENKAQRDFISGTSTVGEYTVYLPTVNNRVFVNQDSWSMPLSISGEQWNTAFKSQGELDKFVYFVLEVFHEKCRLHSENLSRANRNGFIARKFYNENGVINLLQEYCDTDRFDKTGLEEGDNTITYESLKTNKDFIMFCKARIQRVYNRLKAINNLYSLENKEQSVPKDRIVCEFLDSFTLAIDEVDSYVYHNDIITLPNYREITQWQEGGTEEVEMSISAKLGKDISQNDIVVKEGKIIGLMVDKRAILHTNVLRRNPTQYFPFDDITQHEAQYVDQFLNDLHSKGVVFTVQDATVTIEASEDDAEQEATPSTP